MSTNESRTRAEYASAEPGYEDEAVWGDDLDVASRDAKANTALGCPSRVITRLVTITGWSEVV